MSNNHLTDRDNKVFAYVMTSERRKEKNMFISILFLHENLILKNQVIIA
jgi:hypothetical protein